MNDIGKKTWIRGKEFRQRFQQTGCSAIGKAALITGLTTAGGKNISAKRFYSTLTVFASDCLNQGGKDEEFKNYFIRT